MMQLADYRRNALMLRNAYRLLELSDSEFKIRMSGIRAAYREQSKARQAARRKVRTEKEAGRLTPPPRCEICGSTHPLQAHHARHDQALSVRWLCSTDHDDVDKMILIGETK